MALGNRTQSAFAMSDQNSLLFQLHQTCIFQTTWGGEGEVAQI